MYPARSRLRIPGLLLVVGGLAAAAQAPRSAPVEFTRDVLPILREKCVSCHNAAMQQAGLRLDARIFLLSGGKSGPAISEGDSAGSLLIRRVAGSEAGLQMPPTGPLEPSEVAVLRRWVEQGAPWDAAIILVGKKQISAKAAELFLALRRSGKASVRRMLDANRDLLEARDEDGSTPLMYAALYGEPQDVKDLLKRGADPKARNDTGATALMRCGDSLEKTRILVEAGAEVNAGSPAGLTALMLAARRAGSAPVVAYLIGQGAKPSAADTEGQTAFYRAAQGGDVETLALLLDRGADVNGQTKSGQTALMAAARAGRLEAVRLLLSRGARPDPAPGKRSALFHAVLQGDTRMTEALLRAGADPDWRLSYRGYSPLIMAGYSYAAEPGIARLLLARGANPGHKAEDGSNAMEFARRRGHREVVHLIGGNKAGQAASTEEKPGGSPPRTEPSRESVRAAVRKSLPLLTRTGPIFFRKSGCVSCHNNSLPAMALALARERGFPVDEAAAAENVKSAVAATALYKPESLLQLDQVPGEATTLGYTLMGLAAEKYPGDRLTESMALWAAGVQFADGSWNAPSHRPPIEYNPFTATAMGLRAMQLYGPASRQADLKRAIERAAGWLERNAPRDTEGRSFRLLGLVWAVADSQLIGAAARDLLESQRADGGWSQLPGLESDAYASGQALYALRMAKGLSSSDQTYRRGLAYLLSTQQPDGSWLVGSRSIPVQPYFESGFPHGPNQWISAAASGWATLALLLGLS